MFDCIVIGGGPAGMMAADTAARRGLSVLLVEKNNRLGRKLLITGKGRCNLTNNSDPETFISSTVTNPYFMYSGFYSFDCNAVMEYFENSGIPLKTERGKRVFPVSDKASDISSALEKNLKKNKVKILLNTKVKEILTDNNSVIGIKTEKENYSAKSVILATGGVSYPQTGSTGDGYKFSEKLGHTVIKPKPHLVPLTIKEKYCAKLQGLSLKNVTAKFTFRNKILYEDFGEMLFTHFGISGPLVLTASSYMPEFLKNGDVSVSIDLKPAIDAKELDDRILRDFSKNINKNFNNSLDELLPRKMIPVIIKLSGIDEYKKVNLITKNERLKLADLIKNLKFTIVGARGFDEAIITSGGIDTDEISSSTMESKIIKNLYFAGEIIDVDALTGGFNLQIAFSTAYLAGNNVLT